MITYHVNVRHGFKILKEYSKHLQMKNKFKLLLIKLVFKLGLILLSCAVIKLLGGFVSLCWRLRWSWRRPRKKWWRRTKRRRWTGEEAKTGRIESEAIKSGVAWLQG